MLAEARAHATAFDLPFTLTLDDLEIPPVCVLSLKPLDGDSSQVPTLALLRGGLGFTAENIVVISAHTKRRHAVIGADKLRENLRAARDRVTVLLLSEVVTRFNRLGWANELASICDELDGQAQAPKPRRPAKPTLSNVEQVGNWCDLISDEARRDHVAAGYRMPPSEGASAAMDSWRYRVTMSPVEWQEWAEDAWVAEGPWRIPAPKPPRWVQLSF